MHRDVYSDFFLIFCLFDLHRVEQELARLYKNQERRQIREKQKGIYKPDKDGIAASIEGPNGSPASPSVGSGGGGGASSKGFTTRKCANCGQVGHIKTNKKLCPLLNRAQQSTDRVGTGFGSFSAPSVSAE